MGKPILWMAQKTVEAETILKGGMVQPLGVRQKIRRFLSGQLVPLSPVWRLHPKGKKRPSGWWFQPSKFGITSPWFGNEQMTKLQTKFIITTQNMFKRPPTSPMTWLSFVLIFWGWQLTFPKNPISGVTWCPGLIERSFNGFHQSRLTERRKTLRYGSFQKLGVFPQNGWWK